LAIQSLETIYPIVYFFDPAVWKISASLLLELHAKLTRLVRAMTRAARCADAVMDHAQFVDRCRSSPNCPSCPIPLIWHLAIFLIRAFEGRTRRGKLQSENEMISAVKTILKAIPIRVPSEVFEQSIANLYKCIASGESMSPDISMS
jgi:hypothetical protein